MSNLKLPRLTFDNVKSMIESLPASSSNWTGKTVAYATGVACPTYNGLSDSIRTLFVIHHTSVIASLWEGAGNLRVTNAGYGTPTTRTRINAVLQDNGIQWRVSQIAGVQTLVHVVTGEKLYYFGSARFESGVLVAFNEGSVKSGR